MTKIIVAVHGIGEQRRGETIRSVAYQVCRYWETPASMPLGRFGAEMIPSPGGVVRGTFTEDSGGPGRGEWSAAPLAQPDCSFLVETPPDPELKDKVKGGVVCGDVVFGEVYWADIPRGPVAHRYTLEGATQWAQAVVERVRDLDIQAGKFYSERFHYAFAQTVIGQMVEGIGVLGRLCFLAEKAGLFRFDLDDILVNYLGDVQVVTEFRNYRRQILDTFHALMRGVHKEYGGKGIEIYVIGHSEGSVIAFLAMLEALRGQTSGVGPTAGQPLDAPWASSFKGLMTIGSPIGKHLLLWPWLWQHLKHEEPVPPPLGGAIPWFNYYDYGDPVGFGLTQAGHWLGDYGWGGQFDIKDIGFTRYPLPGKAHTDYWTDPGVFGHFLGNVVWPPPPPPAPLVPAVAGPPPAPVVPAVADPPPPAAPGTRRPAWVCSRVVPYLLAAAVLLAGVYLLLKGATWAHGIEQDGIDVTRDLLGVGFLLAAATTVVRVPRLTSDGLWLVGVLVVFAGSLWAFPYIVSDGLRDRLWLLLSVFPIHLLPPLFGMEPATWVVLALACVVVAITCGVGMLWPSTGVKPIVFVGSAVIFSLIGLAWVPSSPFHQYVTVKEVVAEETGLDGPLLDEATSVLMRQLTNAVREDDKKRQLPTGQELRELARPWAEELVHEQKYRDRARPRQVRLLGGAVRLRDNCCAARYATAARAWPLLLMGAGFLYLWWVAALILDLTVVWHHFIKGEAIMRRLTQTAERQGPRQGQGRGAGAFSLLVAGLALAWLPTPAAPPRAAWTADERKQFYHLPEGSEIFPIDWLVALKSSQTGKPFAEDLGRFGFIDDAKADVIRGSGGKRFPIGVTVSKPRGLTLELIGVNCAACHVGQITSKGKSLVIDGAPNMLDIESFYQEIFQSFDAALRDRKELIAFLKRLKANGPRDGPTRLLVALLPWLEKGAPEGGLESVVFQRLQRLVSGTTAAAGQEDYLKLVSSTGAKDARDLAAQLFAKQAERIKKEGEGLKTLADALTGGGKGLQGELGKELAKLGVERLALLEARVAFLKRLKDLHAPGRPQYRPGPGRVDAFVTARNLLFGTADILPADSPVSYPHLWGLSKLGWLHWDGNTNSIMERNVGQSLGLGAVAVAKTGQSTVLPKDLHTLEGLAKAIRAPEWPVATLGAKPINTDLAAAGKKLYGQHCASCHDRQEGAVLVSGSAVYPADKIGTDPRRAQNFATPLSDKTAFADGLAKVLRRIKEQAYKDAGLTPQQSAAMDLAPGKIKWLTTRGYVARPLAGAWATAPYLHNGSVPTLDDLLKPAAERPRVFPLGHREYDLDKLGYVSDPAAVPKSQLGRVFYFDVRQPGNSNAGHEYGDKRFDAKERKAILEYLKTLK